MTTNIMKVKLIIRFAKSQSPLNLFVSTRMFDLIDILIKLMKN